MSIPKNCGLATHLLSRSCSLCSLLREISKIKPRPVAAAWKRKETRTSYPALGIFERWLENLRQQYLPLPSGTAPICFRLLFPEEDIKRKYDIQETRLANYLSQCLGLPRDNLENWNSNDSPGCLGNELKRLLQPKFPVICLWCFSLSDSHRSRTGMKLRAR